MKDSTDRRRTEKIVVFRNRERRSQPCVFRTWTEKACSLRHGADVLLLHTEVRLDVHET